MKRRLRALAAAFTLLLFAAGAVHAQPFYERNPAAGLFGSLWSWAASHLGFLNKEGGMMDPDGLKEGGTMDPDGLKAGGMMDPDGLQSPAPPGSTPDAGVDIDPDG